MGIPMNSIAYVHRAPRNVLAKGFFRLSLPLLALAVSTFGLHTSEGMVSLYGFRIPLFYLAIAAVVTVLIGIISLRIPRG